jgi:hypothetical protein
LARSKNNNKKKVSGTYVFYLYVFRLNKLSLADDQWIMNWKDMEGNGCGLIETLHSPVGTEENNGTCPSG